MPTLSLECACEVGQRLGYAVHTSAGGITLFTSQPVSNIVSDILLIGPITSGEGVDESYLIRVFESNGNSHAAITDAITQATGGHR